ncbi:uncharacterized protein LOC125658641 [Ostrea edulis]|uniref:uncharacterized protein LOC125658641 n=1 Tax=Ostrea edulis TaxID=37623 RepID=UPI0024AEE4BC|nr:uncharacterized protein LOC125658641 [Ostrea edulis]
MTEQPFKIDFYAPPSRDSNQLYGKVDIDTKWYFARRLSVKELLVCAVQKRGRSLTIQVTIGAQYLMTIHVTIGAQYLMTIHVTIGAQYLMTIHVTIGAQYLMTIHVTIGAQYLMTIHVTIGAQYLMTIHVTIGAQYLMTIHVTIGAQYLMTIHVTIGRWMAVLVISVLSHAIHGAPDNRGNEFIIGFMENLGTSTDVEVFVTTTRTVTVNVIVTTPRYSSSINEQFSVKAGEVKQLFFPPEIRPTSNSKVPNAVHVKADDDVVIYAVNKEMFSNDAYLGIPVDVLGKEYYAVTFYPPTRQCELMIVGIEDGTTIKIRFPAKMQQSVSWNGHSYGAGSTLMGTVDRFDTWQLISKGDLTGAYIASDKKIGVISGNKRTEIGRGYNSDHLCEMMDDKDGLKVDGTSFPSSTVYHQVTHNGITYAAGYIEVAEGTHTVRHDSPIKVFGGYLYGKAKYETYAFSTGTRLAPINTPCDLTTTEIGDGLDNDCDGLIDEEACWDSNTDDDGDSREDEDCATPPLVDGKWADWNQWSACSVTCFSTTGASNNGFRSRERTCTNPAPAYDGKQCVGQKSEVEACLVTNVDIYCPDSTRSCKDILDLDPATKGEDGVYNIHYGGQKKEVLCDMTTGGGGWTMSYGIQ